MYMYVRTCTYMYVYTVGSHYKISLLTHNNTYVLTSVHVYTRTYFFSLSLPPCLSLFPSFLSPSLPPSNLYSSQESTSQQSLHPMTPDMADLHGVTGISDWDFLCPPGLESSPDEDLSKRPSLEEFDKELAVFQVHVRRQKIIFVYIILFRRSY